MTEHKRSLSPSSETDPDSFKRLRSRSPSLSDVKQSFENQQLTEAARTETIDGKEVLAVLKDLGFENVDWIPGASSLAGEAGWELLEKTGFVKRTDFNDLEPKAEDLVKPFLHRHNGGSLLEESEFTPREREMVAQVLQRQREGYNSFGTKFGEHNRYEAEFQHQLTTVVRCLFGNDEYEFCITRRVQAPFSCCLGHHLAIPDIAVHALEFDFGVPSRPGRNAFSPSAFVGEYAGDVDPSSPEPQSFSYMATMALLMPVIGIPYDEIVVPGFCQGGWKMLFGAVEVSLESGRNAMFVCEIFVAFRRNAERLREQLQNVPRILIETADEHKDEYYDDFYDFKTVLEAM
ncbi:hypothetical protein HK104_008800 [Borealophlyctis nickersoniae]|nr:hypothetical protein HK104_008800 [Borealophlyctis nickersoniae]